MVERPKAYKSLAQPPPYRPLYGQRRVVLAHAGKLTVKLLRDHWKGTVVTLLALAALAFWDDFYKALLFAAVALAIAFFCNLWRAPVEIIAERESHIQELLNDRVWYIEKYLTAPERVAEDLAAISAGKSWEKDGLWLVRAIADSGARGLSHAELYRLYRNETLDAKWTLFLSWDEKSSTAVSELVLSLMDRSIVSFIDDEGEHIYTEAEIKDRDPEAGDNVEKLDCQLHRIPRLFFLTQRGMEVWRWSFVMKPSPFVWPKKSVFRNREHQTS